MKNGDIANFRLSNSLLGRQRHAAPGDGRLSSACPVTEFADVAFKAELAPKFSYGCAVFLDTDRVNFQKEGFSKEEMLAGLAQVLPKNVWQYVVQIPRLAALGTQVRPPGRHAVQPRGRQGAGRLHQGARPRRRGVRPPAHRRGRRDRRRDGDAPRRQAPRAARPSSASMRRSTSSTRRRTTKRPSATSARTTASARSSTRSGPTGRPAATSPASRARRAPSRARRRCSSLVAERKKIAKQFPNIVDYEAKRAFMHFYDAAPHAGGRARRSKDVEVKKGFFGQRRVEVDAPVQALEPRSRWDARAQVRIGIPRVLNIYSTAPYFRTYFEALGIPKQNVVFSDETTEEMWVEGGKYGSIDPCFPRKVAQAHIHNLLFHHHTREEAAQVHLLPDPHARAELRRRHDGQRELPDRRRRAGRDEGGVHEGGRLLRDARHRVPRSGALVRRAERSWRGACSRRWGPRLGITEDENDHACTRGLEGARRSSSATSQEKGRAILETVEAEDRVAILMIGRPYHSDPGLNHGIPEEFQVLGYPILSRALDPAATRVPRPLLQGGARARDACKTPLELNHVWPENYSANSAQKVWARGLRGAPPERRRARPVELQVRPRRADLRPHRLDHRDEQDAVRGAPRHRRQQAGRLDQDPREDLRPRAQAPRGAPRGRAQAQGRARRTRIDQKRLELLELQHDAAARRASQQDPALEHADRRARASASRAYEAPGHARRARGPPKGLVQLGKKTADGSIVPHRSTRRRRPPRAATAE